jgi:hypothetical protein
MRFRTRIAIPALFAALALAGLVAPGAAQARTVPAAAPATQLGQDAASPLTTTIDGIQIGCYRPSQYVVVANNIHIRATPNGTILYGISNGAYFDSVWHVTCSGITSWYELYTIDQYNGQQWLKGWSHANPSHVGWIGGAYVIFRKYCDRYGC